MSCTALFKALPWSVPSGIYICWNSYQEPLLPSLSPGRHELTPSAPRHASSKEEPARASISRYSCTKDVRRGRCGSDAASPLSEGTPKLVLTSSASVMNGGGWVFSSTSTLSPWSGCGDSILHVTRVTLSPFQADSERYTLPLVTEDKNLRIGQEGNNIILHTAAGVRILYNTATFLLITVPDVYRGRLCGLGGDYDGDPSDDFWLPSRVLAGTTQEFVTSWKVPEKDRACTDGCGSSVCSRCDVASEVTYGRNGSCGITCDAEGPFLGCCPRVSPVEYFTHCVHDVCAARGDHTCALCHVLQAYTAACQAAGATVEAWRTKDFCPLSCPPNSHYELCTRTCDLTCAALVGPAPCTWGGFEGCPCDEGFVFDGDTCVSPELCGCLHRGHYLKVR
ncbi:IgGFc-binding protein-like [Corvus kubaryi]|uniref:IgGFc-binding protein-like n=1 Tax=Corvus kubaryi TaxID=68294 RepID=UPI001C04A119|nr:IgGFc-binding protein-like [Corvus kubaryi]